MAKGQSLQDPFLNALRREHTCVSIYLVNGIKLQGQIESFDQFVIALKDKLTRSNQIVYKHAISSVVPVEKISPQKNNVNNKNRDYSQNTSNTSQSPQDDVNTE